MPNDDDDRQKQRSDELELDRDLNDDLIPQFGLANQLANRSFEKQTGFLNEVIIKCDYLNNNSNFSLL